MYDYSALPAPVWLIDILHILTLSLHFFAMNFMVGGVVIVLWGKFNHRWEHPTVRRFVALFPSIMAATVTLGVAPLLFVQLVYGRQLYSAAIVSGWFWFAIFLVVIATYYAFYAADLSRRNGKRMGSYLFLGFVGLMYVAFVHSSVFSMAEHPALIHKLYAEDPGGHLINPEIGGYVFRWLHMLLGALTVGGFFVGIIGRNQEDAYVLGRRFFLWGAVATALVGGAYMATLGADFGPFVHSAGMWTVGFGALLTAIAIALFYKRHFVPSAALLLVSMAAMVFSRHMLRLIRLAPTFDPTKVPEVPQWSVFAMFAASFVVAVGLIIYMVRMFATARPPAVK